MPNPRRGENENDYVQRCIPVVIRDGTAQDGSQAAAICHDMFRRHQSNNEFDELQTHSIQIDRVELRSELHQGRKHYVLPVVMMVEGVHHGSHGPLYHSAMELGRFPESWNGIPVTVQHPEEDGINVSANRPSVIDRQVVGRIYNARMDGNRLCAEAWVDEARINQVSPQAMSYIQQGRPLEVSVGIFSDEDPTPGRWNGEEYVASAHNIRPDHLALLPGGVGACSWSDGCGIRTNESFEPPQAGNAPATMKKILRDVYNACRTSWVREHPNDRENADNKTSCSRIAWHAVEQAGWKKQGDRWVKTNEEGGDLSLNDTLIDYALRYSGTESTSWSAPSLGDFGVGSAKWSDLSPAERSKVASHYLIGSASAADFGELKLPVVNPRTGKLNERALRAVIGGRGAAVGGVSAAERSSARRRAYRLLNSEFDANLTIPDTLEEIRKEYAYDGMIIQAALTGFREIMQAIQGKLDRMDDDTKVHFLSEVYQNYFIYEVRNRMAGGSALFKRNYTVNSDGTVEFTGEPVGVTRRIEYVTNEETTNNAQGGTTTMAEEKKKPCCPGKVELLIQSKHSPYQEIDREWLSGLEEARVEQLIQVDAALVAAAKKAEEQPQVNKQQAMEALKEELSNSEKFIAMLSPELQNVMKSGMALHREKRQKLINALKEANPQRFTDETLKNRTMDSLEELVSLIPTKADYSINAAGSDVHSGGVQQEILLPPSVPAA